MHPAFSYDKSVRLIALVTLAVFLLYGMLITCFPVLPLWLDEWLLLENLKFKSPAQLWGPLDRTQQFPRVYLQIIKAFSAACSYSYSSLRLPSFLVHSFGVLLLHRLSGRVFGRDSLSRYVWVMLYVSYSTSIHYFAQLKQYTMEMALSLAGMWQLLELLRPEPQRPARLTILWRCMPFAVCPFFSYTYPIIIAPLYIMVALRSLRTGKWTLAAWLPLAAGAISTLVFYYLDVRQVLADEGMQDFWQSLLLKTFSLRPFFTNAYMMFSNLGSGELFGNIFGVLGVAGALYGSYHTVRSGLSARSEPDLLCQYSSILLWIVLGLFIAGRLPLGAYRLNSFMVPALGILITTLLLRCRRVPKARAAAHITAGIVFLAAAGNVFVTMAELGNDEHVKDRRIYQASGRAIRQARQQRLPVFVTSGIAFPFEDRWPGDWILKTHPEYKVHDSIKVYQLSGADHAEQHIRDVAPSIRAAIILDGDSVRTIQL